MSEKISGKAFDIKIFLRLMSYAKRYKLRFFIAAISTITLAFVSAVNPYIVGETVNDFVNNRDIEKLFYYIQILLTIVFAEVLLQFLFIYYANWVGQYIIRDIRAKVFRNIQRFKMSYFDTTSVGRLVTRVVSDIETIANFFTQGVFMIVSDILKMLVVIVVMFAMNWRLALVALSVLPILVYATKVFQVAIKATFQDVRNEIANLNGFVQERVTGMKILQLFTRETIEYQNFKEINNKHKKAHVKTVWYYSIFFPIAEIVSSIAIGLIVWYGGYQILESFTTLGAVIAFIKMSQMLFRPLRQIADKFNQLQMGIVSGERVFKVIDTKSFISKEGSIEASNIKGDLNFNKVRFSYIEGEEVLKGISFKVYQGQTVAIVGATGAGKSTIVNLLNRLYDIDSGKITIDSIDIKTLALKSLRQNIAVVLQDVFLFADTILNNITLNNSAISELDVQSAAKDIGVHNFIMSLPGGYHYNVKERGVMLSSGQRQLISFLRAYVTQPKILVLDEATSSIDSESEFLIQRSTEKLTKGRTSIVIAHRLATIQNATKILLLDNGEVAEEGTHSELILLDKKYKLLFDLQFKK